MLGRLLKLFATGEYRTLPELADKLGVTVSELTGMLDILVATGKLKVSEQNLSGSGGCSGCSGCSAQSSCHTPPDKRSDTDIPEGNIRFYELNK